MAQPPMARLLLHVPVVAAPKSGQPEQQPAAQVEVNVVGPLSLSPLPDFDADSGQDAVLVTVGEENCIVRQGIEVHRGFGMGDDGGEGETLWWCEGKAGRVWTLGLIGAQERDALAILSVLTQQPPPLPTKEEVPISTFTVARPPSVLPTVRRLGTGVRQPGFRNSLVLYDEATHEVLRVLALPSPPLSPTHQHSDLHAPAQSGADLAAQVDHIVRSINPNPVPWGLPELDANGDIYLSPADLRGDVERYDGVRRKVERDPADERNGEDEVQVTTGLVVLPPLTTAEERLTGFEAVDKEPSKDEDSNKENEPPTPTGSTKQRLEIVDSLLLSSDFYDPPPLPPAPLAPSNLTFTDPVQAQSTLRSIASISSFATLGSNGTHRSREVYVTAAEELEPVAATVEDLKKDEDKEEGVLLLRDGKGTLRIGRKVSRLDIRKQDLRPVEGLPVGQDGESEKKGGLWSWLMGGWVPGVGAWDWLFSREWPKWWPSSTASSLPELPDPPLPISRARTRTRTITAEGPTRISALFFDEEGREMRTFVSPLTATGDVQEEGDRIWGSTKGWGERRVAGGA